MPDLDRDLSSRLRPDRSPVGPAVEQVLLEPIPGFVGLGGGLPGERSISDSAHSGEGIASGRPFKSVDQPLPTTPDCGSCPSDFDGDGHPRFNDWLTDRCGRLRGHPLALKGRGQVRLVDGGLQHCGRCVDRSDRSPFSLGRGNPGGLVRLLLKFPAFLGSHLGGSPVLHPRATESDDSTDRGTDHSNPCSVHHPPQGVGHTQRVASTTLVPVTAPSCGRGMSKPGVNRASTGLLVTRLVTTWREADPPDGEPTSHLHRYRRAGGI